MVYPCINDIFARSGYEQEAEDIQNLYLAGDKEAAQAAIPERYLEDNSLIGSEGFVRDRLQALQESGVNALNVSMMGQTLEDRVKTCEQLRNIVDTL